MSTFTVPYPPSANKLWRYVNGRAIKSATYRKWMDIAVATIIHQRPEKVPGKYTMEVYATRPDKRARDLSNLLKATEDAVVLARVVDDDSKAEKITLGWSVEGPLKGGAILVRIQPYAPDASLAEAA